MRGQSAEEFQVQVARHISDFNWNEALITAGRGLELYPDNSKLTIVAGALNLQMGNISEGGRFLQRAVSLKPREPEVLRLLGELKMSLGEMESAIAVLQAALESNREDPLVRFRLAQSYFMTGRTEDAAALMKGVIQAMPASMEYRRFNAVLLEHLGRTEDAYRELRAAQKLDPRDVRTLLRLSDRERHSGRPLQAIEYLEVAAEIDPENPLFFEELAGLYTEVGREKDANQARHKAERLKEAFSSYGATLRLTKSKEFEKAIELLERTCEENSEFVTGRIALADLYRKAGRREEAVRVYREVMENQPDGNWIRERAAWIQVENGNLEEALELLYEAEELSLSARLLRGYERQLNSDWEAAYSEFRRVEEQYPLHPDVLRQISLCLESMGRPEESLAYLEKAHRAAPNDVQVIRQARRIRFEYAIDLQNQQKWKEALKILDRLILEEETPDYFFHRAYCLQNLFEYEAAIASFRRGLELQPEVEWARMNLSTCLYAVGEYDESAAEWEYLVGRDPSPMNLYNLGLSRIRQWRLEEGWNLVEQAARLGHSPAVRLLKKSRGQDILP